jgi:hypothetical protein
MAGRKWSRAGSFGRAPERHAAEDRALGQAPDYDGDASVSESTSHRTRPRDAMPDGPETANSLRGSLYNAYGDKEEIFLRVFERYAERFIADARKALNMSELRNALTDFFAFAIRSITQGSPARGCLSTKNCRRDRPRIAARARTRNEDARRARGCIAWCTWHPRGARATYHSAASRGTPHRDDDAWNRRHGTGVR